MAAVEEVEVRAGRERTGPAVEGRLGLGLHPVDGADRDGRGGPRAGVQGDDGQRGAKTTDCTQG